ncbi:major capsid protein [Aestuariivirga sp.]|jgi:hypothetical protein|uniref:major capsid protein n=1 Tax=Aestuariivirga sp. TaxID=2650926 RepID=UPI003783E5A5
MTVLMETRHPGEFILSEANGQRSREAITIASGAGIIAAGTVLGKITASGKYFASAVGASDGSQVPAAIAIYGADASAADVSVSAIVRDAEVNGNCLANRAGEASQFFARTEEFHRLNIVKTGRLLDTDNSVLFDYYTEFGETPAAEIDFDLDNASPAEGVLRKKCAGIIRQMASILDGIPFTNVMAICGDTFFDDLIAHKEVRDTYKGYADAASLRGAYVSAGVNGFHGSFDFGGITWANYKGGGTIGIDTNKCHLFPTGVPGLFRTVYGPADYIETVNTPGQRLYAKQWEMMNGKGVNLEFQMNALHYCTRPRVLIPGKRT